MNSLEVGLWNLHIKKILFCSKKRAFLVGDREELKRVQKLLKVKIKRGRSVIN